MTRFIDCTHQVFNNPFLLYPILVSFYKNLLNVNSNLLLAYVVFPLVLSKDGQNILKNLKSTSSILKLQAENKVLIFRLNARIDEYKMLTNNCIQYCLDNEYLLLDGVNVKVGRPISLDLKKYELCLSVRCAERLGRVLSNYDVVDVFKFLGIKKL